MNPGFDPYYHWLGIPREEQPPNLYRLLGVRTFENNPEVLSNAADRQMLHVRSFQTGPRSGECQQLLNELSAARSCLLDPTRKSGYDQALAAYLQAAQQPVPVRVTVPIAATANYAAAAPNAPTPAVEPTGIAIGVQGGRSQPGARKRRSEAPRSPVMIGAQILAGGIAGVALAIAILWYGFGSDPLGIMPDRPEESLVQNDSPPSHQRDRPGQPAPTDSRRAAAPVTKAPGNKVSVGGATAETTNSSSSSTSLPERGTNAPRPSRIDDQMELNGGSGPGSPDRTPSFTPSAPAPPRNLSDLGQPPKKHPAPTEQQSREALAQLREAIGDDLAPGSSREERLARFTRLRKLADEIVDEPHVLYVVLREAYLDAGNLRLYDDASQIVDRLVSNFEVDEVAVRSKMLKDFAQAARAPAERMAIATASLTLAEQAHRAEKFEVASELAEMAEGQAAKVGNAGLRTQARQRDSEYKRALRARQTYEKSLAVVEVDPEDAGANAIVGRYLALVKGDFDRAVPHLAKSDDARLQPLAQLDVAGPVSPEHRLALADAWFDLAAADAELAPVFARARHWYELAEQGAAGLVAVRVRSRLDQIDQAEKSGAFVDRARSLLAAGSASAAAANPASDASAAGLSPSPAPFGVSPSPRSSSPITPPPTSPFPPGPPFAGARPPAGVMPQAAYDRVNQLAPTAWRAVLPQRDSRQVIVNPSISIQNDAGVVTVSKERSAEFESIHLINDIPLPPEFTARLSVTFPKSNSAGGGTRIPYLGLRSPDGRSQTYVHVDSGVGETHEIVLTRRAGALTVTWDDQPKRVYDDKNLVPAQIFFHLNEDASLVIESLVIEP